MMKILMSVLLSAMTFAVAAEESRQLDVRTTVEKEIVVTDEAGEKSTRLIVAETVAPGDKVFYTITFRNVGTQAAENVVITNPISDSLSYVANSAFGPGTVITFSVDGGQSFATSGDLTVTEEGEDRPAEAEDFTHVRWAMEHELAVGAQGIARFAAVLD